MFTLTFSSMHEPRRFKTIFGFSVRSLLQCAWPAPLQSHMFCSLTKVFYWPAVNEKLRFWRDCQMHRVAWTVADHICYNGFYNGVTDIVTTRHEGVNNIRWDFAINSVFFCFMFFFCVFFFFFFLTNLIYLRLLPAIYFNGLSYHTSLAF